MVRLITTVVFILLLPLAQAADLARGTRAFDNDDFNTARTELKPLAEAGDAQAQLYVGVMYATGNGYRQDMVQAHSWLSLSAAAGNKDAQQARGRIEPRMTRSQLRRANAQTSQFRPTRLAQSQNNNNNSW